MFRLFVPALLRVSMRFVRGKTIPLPLWLQFWLSYFMLLAGMIGVGFYRTVAPNLLKIGPYHGRHGCLVMPFDRWVCGSAARQRVIQLVDDVDRFEGHIACSTGTKSELVIPCFNQAGRLLGVLDIDSDQTNFFKWQGADQLDRMLRQLFHNAS